MKNGIALLEKFTRPHRGNQPGVSWGEVHMEDIRSQLILPKVFQESVSALLDHTGNLYQISEIDKGNGRKRVIEAPIDTQNLPLKEVQKIIHRTLCPLDNGKSSHGFRPFQSAYTGIVKMAHIMGQKENTEGIQSVYSLDVQNFFPSITDDMIRKEVWILLTRLLVTYKKWPKITKNELESLIDIIIEICSYEWRLPQGAPSSPVLANIVTNRIDERIRHAVEDIMWLQGKSTYGRYADDLVLMSWTHLSQSQRKMIRQIINDFWLSIANEKTIYEENKGSYNIWWVEVINGKHKNNSPHITFRISPERDKEYAATILEISDQIQSGKLSDSSDLQNALNKITGMLGFSYHISTLWDGERIIAKIKSGKKRYFLSDRCEHAWGIFLMNHENILHLNCRKWFTGTDFLEDSSAYFRYKSKTRRWKYGWDRDFSGFKEEANSV